MKFQYPLIGIIVVLVVIILGIAVSEDTTNWRNYGTKKFWLDTFKNRPVTINPHIIAFEIFCHVLK